MELSDTQLERYSRHILLPQVDISGQQKLLNAHVLIIGMGGLGSPASIYLASSGVGMLTLCDYDRVELSNLQRQILYQHRDIGTSKVASARATLRALNPDVKINIINHALHGEALDQQVILADVVIDASDNFATRFEINHSCYKNETLLISGAAIRLQGQIAVFNGNKNNPCYRCLYPESSLPADESCSDSGVLAPLVGIIGATMALETIKLIMHIGSSLAGYLLMLDAASMQWRKLKLPRDPECPNCSTSPKKESVL